MAEHKVRVEDEDGDFRKELPTVDTSIFINLDDVPKTQYTDPFLKANEELRDIRGTTPAFKRKVTNDLKKFQAGTGGAGTKRVDKDAITAYNTFESVVPPYNLDYLARLYVVSAPHYSAVNAKVANIVGLGYKLVESSQTKRRLEDISDNEARSTAARKRLMRAKDELEQLLESFNQEDTFTETLIKVWRDYETTGNGYIEIGRKKDGTIGYIGHAPAVAIRVRRARDGFVQLNGKDAVFFRNFGDTETANPFGNDRNPNEIIHIKKYSPTSTFYGVPDIISAINAVAGNEFADRFNLDYFENKAIPRHLIITKGINLGTKLQADILTFFQTSLKGNHHRSLLIPLPAETDKNKVDVKIEPIEADAQDSSFGKYRRENISQILMAHRVPITKVGFAEGASLAVARDSDKTFKEQVCQPEQRNFEKKINKILRDLGADAFDFKLNEMTLTDADTQSKIDERMVKAGIWLPNEPRVRDGMPTVKGGNTRVDLNQKTSQARAEERTTRERDSSRSAGETDSAGEGRNPKGEGRSNGE